MEFRHRSLSGLTPGKGGEDADVLRVTLGWDPGVVGSTEQGLPTNMSSVGLKWPGYTPPPAL